MTGWLAELSLEELQALLRAGLVEPVGATRGVRRVDSYSLTPAGRILLRNRWDSDNFPTAEK